VTEIGKQLELNRSYPQVKGSVMFRYKFFADNPDLATIVREHWQQ
jgi:hypothetical protein